MWNGTAATLNPKPASISIAESMRAGLLKIPRLDERCDIPQVRGACDAVGERDAVQEYARGERAEEEVLQGGSLERMDFLMNPARTYKESAISSSPRYIVIRSAPDARTIMPVVAKRMRV